MFYWFYWCEKFFKTRAIDKNRNPRISVNLKKGHLVTQSYPVTQLLSYFCRLSKLRWCNRDHLITLMLIMYVLWILNRLLRNVCDALEKYPRRSKFPNENSRFKIMNVLLYDNYIHTGRVVQWLTTCTRKLNAPSSSLAASYMQRWAPAVIAWLMSGRLRSGWKR